MVVSDKSYDRVKLYHKQIRTEDLWQWTVHARYFLNVSYGGHDCIRVCFNAPDMETDNLSLGLGKMFTIHKSVFVEPKVVYHTGEKTTNMMLGFGLKF